jgi:hypothetical protein
MKFIIFAECHESNEGSKARSGKKPMQRNIINCWKSSDEKAINYYLLLVWSDSMELLMR